MRLIAVALLLLSLPAWCLAEKTASRDSAGQDKTLVVHAPESWLKIYSLPIYRENWTLQLAVKRLARDLPKVKDIFTKLGASMPAPEGPAEAKDVLIYHCTRKTASEALSRLSAVGRVQGPAIQPILEPVSLPDVQRKIGLLEADESAHKKQLAEMPAVSELVGEVLDHLRTVEAALRKPDRAVLLRLTVKEER
jgi:hypothetical protein